jgi:hypothetical protein
MTSYSIVDTARNAPVKTGIPSWEEARRALSAARKAHRGGDFQIHPDPKGKR